VASNGPGILAISLADAALGGPVATSSAFDNDVNTDTSSISLAGVAAGDFVLANYVTQGDANAITVNAPATEIGSFNGTFQNEIGSAKMATGYVIPAAPGTATVDFDGGESSREALVIARFAQVPEPSTALLGALGALCLLLRRR